MLFPEELMHTVIYYSDTVKFSLNMQKKYGGSEKSELWNLGSLIVPLITYLFNGTAIVDISEH